MNIRSRIIFNDIRIIPFLAVLSLSIFILNGNQNAFATHNADHILGFAAAGDWGCNSNTDATATAIFNKGTAIDIVFGLGDYSYQPTATCFINEMSESGNNIKPKMDGVTLTGGTGSMAIGNHEDDSDEARSTYSSSFNFPNSGYYSYNVGTSPNKVHFLVMTTEDTFSVGSAQHTFVTNDLSQAASDSNIKWIIVVFHKPLYSSPNECGSSTCAGYPSFRSIYHPIFDQRGVDLVLVGHTHDYQRTFPITYGGSQNANPVKQSNNLNNYNDPTGIIQALVGTGGVNIHELDGQSSFTAYQQDDRFGFLQVDITKSGENQVLTGKFFGNGLANAMDTFTITKGTQAPKYHFEPAGDFDGTTNSDIVEVPNAANLQFPSTFSVSLWFKTSTNFATDARMVMKGNFDSELTGQNLNYGLWMNSAEQLRFGFEGKTGYDKFVTTPQSYSDGQWHHFVGVYDDAGDKIQLYIDGVLVRQVTSTSSIDPGNTHPLVIGKNSGVSGKIFNGQLDEVRLWKGLALTQAQVTEAYNNGNYPGGTSLFENFGGSGQMVQKTQESLKDNDTELKTQSTIENLIEKQSEKPKIQLPLPY